MSRFNELYRGEPGDAADQLEEQEATEHELRAALCNAPTTDSSTRTAGAEPADRRKRLITINLETADWGPLWFLILGNAAVTIWFWIVSR